MPILHAGADGRVLGIGGQVRPQREITCATLEDGDSRLVLRLFEWDPGDPLDQARGWLTLSMQVDGPGGRWSGRSSVSIRPELSDLAGSARSSAAGEEALPVLWDDRSPRLAFDFSFEERSGCVEVSVVVDDEGPDRDDRRGSSAGDTARVRLRVPSGDVQAFAEAVEQLASRSPGRLAWIG